MRKLLLELSSKLEHTKNEESIKTSIILPFLSKLGYDVFDPKIIIPEYTADQSTKNGEKVDYCVNDIDFNPVCIIECKKRNEDLNLHNTQLERYFCFVNCKIAVLTNGESFMFYTDYENRNLMDKIPFLELDINNPTNEALEFLNLLNRDSYNKAMVYKTAKKYYKDRENKRLLYSMLDNMDTDFCMFLSSKFSIYQSEEDIKSLFSDNISSYVIERYDKIKKERENIIVDSNKQKGIVTTNEEINSFNRIVDILKYHSLDYNKVSYKDVKSYFAVLYSNNTRKPICRFYLDGKIKYIGVFDDFKNEVKYVIKNNEDILMFTHRITETFKIYNNENC